MTRDLGSQGEVPVGTEDNRPVLESLDQVVLSISNHSAEMAHAEEKPIDRGHLLAAGLQLHEG